MVKAKLENSKFLLQNDSSGEEAWQIVFDYKWSPGELYWIKSSGRKVILLRPGDYIEHSRFEKFRNGKMNVNFNATVDISYMESGIRIFEELKFANEIKGEKEARKNIIRNKYLRWSAPYFWEGEQGLTLLEMISLFTKVFYELDKKSHNTFSNLPMSLQMRSLSLSSMICSTALIVGYTDFKFLQDLFHLSLFFDVSLQGEAYAYLFEDVLENERLRPGSGEEMLKEDNFEHKLNILKLHPENSADKAARLLEGIIHNKNLIKLIKLHHETFEGKGFPNGVNVHELNDIEKIIVASCKSMPQKVNILEKVQEEGLIFNYITKGLEKGSILSRLKSQIVSSYNSLSDDDEEYLKVVGF